MIPKLTKITGASLVLAVILAGSAGAGGPTRADIEKGFAAADRDGNGTLSLAEFVKSGESKKRFRMIDANGDKKLTRKEVLKYIGTATGA